MLPSKTGPTPQIPAVLVFGGHDPSGGAGIAADISTLLALGCHPVVVITAITVQNTTQLQRYQLLEPGLVAAQAEALLEDIPIAACKTGMLGSAAIVAAVAEAVTALSAVPLVVDPVLRADAGGLLGEPDLVAALQTALLPYAALATPNIDECRALTSTAEPDQAARELMARGCKNILVTGTHAPTPKVVHRLYQTSNETPEISQWPRLSGIFHGSGCTLATAVAAHLAHGEAMADAVNHALEYTYQSLRSAYRSGSGQSIPQRLWRMHRVDP
jgi:hydroxymethylpyrimidine/phosphomethylpyrimidine kinase